MYGGEARTPDSIQELVTSNIALFDVVTNQTLSYTDAMVFFNIRH